MFPNHEIIALIRDLGLVGRNVPAHEYCLAECLDTEMHNRTQCDLRGLSIRNRNHKHGLTNVLTPACHCLSLPFEQD